jgi:GNAT superfamily N-acetyltransferase
MPKRRWDVPTLRTIFTLDHPEFTCAPSVVDLGADNFWITGGIKTPDGALAGSFVRRLVRRNAEWIALHENFAVHAEFRRRGIAFSHYRKVLREYRRLGCFRVEMFAQEHGVFVWPQFGFRYRHLQDRRDVTAAADRLHRRLTGSELPIVPRREWELIVMNSPSGEQIGAEAARLTAARHPTGALEMVLDLHDRSTLSFLVDRGIFDAEEIR